MDTIKTSELTRQVMKRAISFQKKKYRNIESAILIEGLLPLEEAIKSNYVIEEVYYNPFLLNKPGVREMLIGLQTKDQSACYEINGSELKQISTEVNPQGIVAVAKQRDYQAEDLKGNLLVLDQLQDPGNVGTLFRIAHWFGLGGLILMKGTVDVHNPKVIRSSMGSFFHMPFIYSDDLPESLIANRTLLLSKAHSEISIQDMKPKELSPFLLVIGNEARGIDLGFDDLPHRDITLPALGGAESLNAAVAGAAILSKLLY
ncbi:MAG: RNA methyltransferase [Candidatus Marinimicrobia bacterium]|nr:RNA methyltransferase [Candidatus Neomarinimicrobiota bacterium]